MTNLDRVAARAQRANIPLSVLLEITGRCNLDCQHCYLDIRHPPEEMSTAEILRVLDELSAAGTLFLTISGGEVFLRHDLYEILEHARRLGLVVRLNTSGTRIGRAEAERLASLGLATVELSVYSHHADVHDDVTRRRRSFRRTVRAALLLRRYGMNVILKAPLIQSSAEDYRGILDLARRLGAQGKLDPGIITRRDGDPTPAALRPSAEALAVVLRDPEVFGADRPLPPPAKPEDAPCAIGRRVARIGPEGGVYPCSTYPEPVGNVRERSFADIWWGDSPLLARLRAVRFADLDPACSSCSHSGYCNRCLALAVIEHGDWRAPVAEACRIAHAHDLAAGRAGPPPPGLARPRRRSLPVVAG